VPEQTQFMRRPAPPAPLPCFALEHDGADPKCRTCPHEARCLKATGSRAGRVPLSRLAFSLGPVAQLDSGDPDREDVLGTYASCYRQVFKRAPARMTQLQGRRLRAGLRRDGITLRLYIFAAMMAFRDTNEGSPGRRFHARMLLGPAAKKNVEMYRQAAAGRYGVFDMTTLLSMVGPTEDATRALAASEWLAARWVVGHRQKWGEGAVNSLYNAQELALDPRWLSTEPTYTRRWLEAPTRDSDELKRHRHRVAQAGRDRDEWRREREKILPDVLRRVLAHYGHREADFEARSPVRHPMAFWSALGDAILWAECLLSEPDPDPDEPASTAPNSAAPTSTTQHN